VNQATRHFQQVRVWQKAHAFVLEVYRATENFPKHELYGLRSQLRRAAVSIPANFAEGYKKRGKSDKARYMNIAQGSLEEVRYYLILTQDLGYAVIDALMNDLEEISRMLEAYVSRLLTSGS
jgi:four helix bundle protein